jgi:hypothetical protein
MAQKEIANRGALAWWRQRHQISAAADGIDAASAKSAQNDIVIMAKMWRDARSENIKRRKTMAACSISAGVKAAGERRNNQTWRRKKSWHGGISTSGDGGVSMKARIGMKRSRHQ